MGQIVFNFLELLNIPISKRYVQALIYSHPDFPSILSISDIFQRLGIDHAVRRIEKYDLIGLSYPFLLQLNKVRGGFTLIKNKQDLTNHERDLIDSVWVVLQAKPRKETSDKGNNDLVKIEGQIKFYAIGLIATLIVLLIVPFYYSFSWLLVALLSTAVSGLIVAYVLMAKELGTTYERLDAWCNGRNNTNCDKVLKADLSIFGITLSDAAVVYFAFQCLTLALAGALPAIKQTFLPSLSFLSLVTWPIVIWSLHYQYFIAKTWCRLCLLVDAILVIQAMLFSFGYLIDVIQPATARLGFLVGLTLIFLIVWFLIMLVRNTIEHVNRLRKLGIQGNRVKHAIPVFSQLLMQQKMINSKPFENEMIVGDPLAPVKIIMVINTDCAPCKEKHAEVALLVAMYPEKVRIAFRFVRSEGKVRPLLYLIGFWLKSIHGKDDEYRKTMNLISDWFAIWDLEKFMLKYPIDLDGVMEAVEKLEEAHYQWIKNADLHRTPILFINGYELPKEYHISDLVAMMPGLSDFSSSNSKIELLAGSYRQGAEATMS